MITRMEVDNSLPGAPILPLGGFAPNDEAVQIKNIEGLGPVKSEIAGTPFATGRGELYQGSSTGKRNIVLTLGLNPNWVDQSIASLRKLLYRYFMTENWCQFRFFSDEHPTVHINGTIESFEPNIFSQNPEVQVSIICPKPDFLDTATTLFAGSSDPTATVSIDYAGDVPTGFELRVHPSSSVPSYSGQIWVVNTVGPFSQTFKMQAVTVDGTMYFKMVSVLNSRQVLNVFSDGQTVNILEKMVTDSTWPELSPGVNHLIVNTGSSVLDWTLGYFNRYGGL